MTTILQKWGNSQGLRIPKSVLEEAGLAVGAEVELTTDGHSIFVRPHRPARRRGKYTMDDLVRGTPKDFRPGEVDSGPPVGEEAW